MAKNKQKKVDELEELLITDKVVLHSMPKKNRRNKLAKPTSGDTPKQESHKNTGLFIVVGGGLGIVIIVAVLYFVLFQNSEQVVNPVVKIEEPIKVVKKETSKREVPTKKEPVVTEVSDEKDIPATSTKKVITSKIPVIEKAVDTDSDGLTDKEETALSSNINMEDTDGDGYSDISELQNLYNPAGDGKLVDNPSFSLYRSDKYKYSFVYPSFWKVQNISNDDSIIIKAPNGQMLQVVLQDNLGSKSIESWYKESFGVSSVPPKQIISFNSWQGIRSDDGLFVFFAESGKIFSISYNLGMDNTVYYKNIFNALVSSFTVEK